MGDAGEKSFNSSIAFDKGNLILGIISLLAGGYIGMLLPPLVQDPTDPTYWPLWLLTAACVLLVAGIGGFIIMVCHHKAESGAGLEAISKLVQQMDQSNGRISNLVEQTVSRQADLIPRDKIYLEMAEAFNNATSAISVVTLLAVDWETGKRNFTPALTSTPNRDEFYEAVKRAIARDDIAYERIWQVPPDKGEFALQALFSDPLHKEEYDLIAQYRKTNPHLAKFMIAPTLTTASFILIDGKKLFFNFDIYNEETRELESPYMLFIKDASGNVFDPLKGLIARFKPLTIKAP